MNSEELAETQSGAWGGGLKKGRGDRGGRLQNPMLLCLESKRYPPKSRPCQPCTSPAPLLLPTTKLDTLGNQACLNYKLPLNLPTQFVSLSPTVSLSSRPTSPHFLHHLPHFSSNTNISNLSASSSVVVVVHSSLTQSFKWGSHIKIWHLAEWSIIGR